MIKPYDNLRFSQSRSPALRLSRSPILKFARQFINPLPWSVTLWVTEARRVLVTAASRSCALASKLRL